MAGLLRRGVIVLGVLPGIATAECRGAARIEWCNWIISERSYQGDVIVSAVDTKPYLQAEHAPLLDGNGTAW